MKVRGVILDSVLDRAGMGVCGAVQHVARELGAEVELVVPSAMSPEDQAELAAVADSVLTVDAIERRQNSPEDILGRLEDLNASVECIVFGNGTYPEEIAPRLAFRLGGSCVGDVQEVGVKEGEVIATRAVYGGKAMARLVLKSTPAVLWVRAAAMPSPEKRSEPGKVSAHEASDSKPAGARLVERHAEAVEGVRLEDARVIVSGGRGLGGAEAFERLKALAVPMGAEIAASRAACDLGWVPHSWQVGQTGKKVAPELYLAIAMSGSSQHLMGIANAKNVVAINIDPDAPIFKHCRFGIVADYDEVVDLLKEKLASNL